MKNTKSLLLGCMAFFTISVMAGCSAADNSDSIEKAVTSSETATTAHSNEPADTGITDENDISTEPTLSTQAAAGEAADAQEPAIETATENTATYRSADVKESETTVPAAIQKSTGNTTATAPTTTKSTTAPSATKQTTSSCPTTKPTTAPSATKQTTSSCPTLPSVVKQWTSSCPTTKQTTGQKTTQSTTQPTTTVPPTAATTTATTNTGSDLKSQSIANSKTYRAFLEEVLRYTNEVRAEVGVAPLTLDDSLCQAASMRSLEMDYAKNMSHTRPDGTSCFTVLKQFNISYMACGENIAYGYRDAKAVVEAWKNSPSHYENMVSSKFSKLGVGYSSMNNVPYWTQLFTN